MTQQEAIKALSEWAYAGEDAEPGTTEGWARMEYLRLLASNVAAIAQGNLASCTGLIGTTIKDEFQTPAGYVELATTVTHATIESLTDGAKEGGE